jgi:hypothetical protein
MSKALGGGPPAFSLPMSSQQSVNYLARFYSGGWADPGEDLNVAAGDYAGGQSLNTEAMWMNILDVALDLVAAMPGTDVATDAMNCALQQTAKDLVNGALVFGNTNTISGYVSAVNSAANQVFQDYAACGASATVSIVVGLSGKALGFVPFVGEILEGLAAVSNAGQAVQGALEMKFRASAVETAIIPIKPGSAAVNNPVPKITSLSPASAAVGGSSATVTIKGSSFLQSATVLANDVMRTYTYVDSGTLTFNLTSSDLAQASTFSVEVRNPTPGGGTSTSVFTVVSGTGSNPQPQVTSLTPSAAVVGAVVGAAIMPLSILGNNFMSNSSVTFAGSPHTITTPNDAGQLTINLTATDLAKTGTFPVVVTNPGPGGGASACAATTTSCNFTVLSATPSQPAVTSISTPQRAYVAGDQFGLNYALLANPTSQVKYDLMITILSLASGSTYYYYDNPSDTNEWLHTTVAPAVSNYVPQSGNHYQIPSGATVFQITSDVPTGDYHVKAYFSVVNANQPIGTSAETDFSVATSTAAGGCFVATAAFGSPMARQVQWLRAFRDQVLLGGRAGRAFVNWYYAWSPRAAAWLRAHSVARKLTRAVLWIPVAFAWSSLRTSVAFASLGLLVLLVSLGWSLRRGPAWWRGLCLLILAIGVASAESSPYKPMSERISSTRMSSSIKAFRPQSKGETAVRRGLLRLPAVQGQAPSRAQTCIGETRDSVPRFLARANRGLQGPGCGNCRPGDAEYRHGQQECRQYPGCEPRTHLRVVWHIFALESLCSLGLATGDDDTAVTSRLIFNCSRTALPQRQTSRRPAGRRVLRSTRYGQR